jgi:hypothetical protein
MMRGMASSRWSTKRLKLPRKIAREPWISHNLSSQLRAAEERARELEAEADHFRKRAATAEKWLVAIHNEVEQTFFSEEKRP